MASDGGALAVWHETVASELSLRAERHASGGTWTTTGAVLDNAASPVLRARVAAWTAGSAIAVWEQDVSGVKLFYSYFDQTSWTPAAVVSTSSAGLGFCLQAGSGSRAIVVAPKWAGVFRDGSWGSLTSSGSDTASVAGCFLDDRGSGAAIWSVPSASGRSDLVAKRFLLDAGWGTPAFAEDDDGGTVVEVGEAGCAADGSAYLVWARNPASNQATVWFSRFD
jgi:hypothetical protein